MTQWGSRALKLCISSEPGEKMVVFFTYQRVGELFGNYQRAVYQSNYQRVMSKHASLFTFMFDIGMERKNLEGQQCRKYSGSEQWLTIQWLIMLALQKSCCHRCLLQCDVTKSAWLHPLLLSWVESCSCQEHCLVKSKILSEYQENKKIPFIFVCSLK